MFRSEMVFDIRTSFPASIPHVSMLLAVFLAANSRNLNIVSLGISTDLRLPAANDSLLGVGLSDRSIDGLKIV